MKGSNWDVSNDALVAEHVLASTMDPVTNRPAATALNTGCLHPAPDDAVVSVVTLAYDTPTTRSLPGRARGVDVAERALCRDLDLWADAPGSVVAIGEAAAAYVALHSPDESRELRSRLDELRVRTRRAVGPRPLVAAAQGPAATSADVTARAIERLVLPPGTVPVQDHWSAGEVSRRPLWDAVTGERFGTQVRLHAAGLDGAHAERAEGLLSLTRSTRYVDVARAAHGAIPHIVAASPVEGPVLWDASAVLSGTGPARGSLAQLLAEQCPPGVWIGVSAWLAAVDEVMEALRTLRAQGRRIVLTFYGSGREPLAAFDELPVNAVLMDPYLEHGAALEAEDRSVHAAILEHAARNGIPALTGTRAALQLHRRPVPAPRPRTPHPGGQLLERARLVGLTLRQTALLVNATHGQDTLAPRWDRYDVAMHWAQDAT